MTANSLKIVNFLKGNYGTKMTAHQIADALEVSLPTVTGSVNGLVKKGYAIREEVEVPGEGDKTVKVKYISLTEDGMNYDPVAEEAAKEAEKAAKKAEREAAKAAAKAAKEAE